MLLSGAVEIYTIIKQIKTSNATLHYRLHNQCSTSVQFLFWNTHDTYLIAANTYSQREADPCLLAIIGIHDYVTAYMANARLNDVKSVLLIIQCVMKKFFLYLANTLNKHTTFYKHIIQLQAGEFGDYEEPLKAASSHWVSSTHTPLLTTCRLQHRKSRTQYRHCSFHKAFFPTYTFLKCRRSLLHLFTDFFFSCSTNMIDLCLDSGYLVYKLMIF